MFHAKHKELFSSCRRQFNHFFLSILSNHFFISISTFLLNLNPSFPFLLLFWFSKNLPLNVSAPGGINSIRKHFLPFSSRCLFFLLCPFIPFSSLLDSSVCVIPYPLLLHHHLQSGGPSARLPSNQKHFIGT